MKVDSCVFLVKALLFLCIWPLALHCYDINTHYNFDDIEIKCEGNETLDSLKPTKSYMNQTITPSTLSFKYCPPPKNTFLKTLKEINIDATKVNSIFFENMVDTDKLVESLFVGMPLRRVSFTSFDGHTYVIDINSTENLDLADGDEYTIDCYGDGDGLLHRKKLLLNRMLSVTNVVIDGCLPPTVSYSNIMQNLNVNSSSVEKLDLTIRQGSLKPVHFKGLYLRKLDVIFKTDYSEFNPKIFEKIADEIYLQQVYLKKLPKSSIKKVTLVYGKFYDGFKWDDCSSLTSLTLQRFSVPEIPGGLLRDCHNLRELELKSLTQKEVDQTLMGASALVNLSILGCDFGVVAKPIAENALNLRTLRFKDYTLYNLTENTFSKPKKLEKLDVWFDNLNVYETLVAMTPLENLHELILFDSTGTFCTNYYNYKYHYLPTKPYRNFALGLERLTLVHSELSEMCFEDWINLNYLDLRETQIRKLKLLNLPVPREHPLTVKLSSQKLSIPSDLDYVTMTEYFQGSQNITILLDITVECDCDSSLLVWALRGLPQISLQDVTCTDGQRFLDFAANSVGCNKYSCDNCTCRTAWDDGATVADCGSRGLRILPKLESSLKTSSEVRKKVFVKKILASGNFIETLPELEYTDTSIEVDLGNNNISRISENALDRLDTFFSGGNRMYLSGNPLVCECETQDMLNVLRNYKDQVPDYKDLTCSYSNRKSFLHKLADRSLCAERALTAFGIVSLSLLALAAITAFIFVRYKLTIKAFLYARGLCLFCVREEELDADREYDAFVSFAHSEDEFVADVLLPGLENDYNLCVHTRNWMPGEMIHTQILESVQKSRRTIIVLSKSFVESVWGMTEFRTAYSNSLREGRVRVICVVVDDVIDDVNLDSELKNYLKSNTYLKFNDPWFWQKLRYAMPHPNVTNDQSGVQNQNEEDRHDVVELASR